MVITTNNVHVLPEKWRGESGDYPESKQECAAELERALSQHQPVAWRIVWSPYPGGTEVTEDQARVLKIQTLASPPVIEPLYATPQPSKASGSAPDVSDEAIERALDAKLGLDHTLRQLIRGDTMAVGFSKVDVVRALLAELGSTATPPASAPEVTEFPKKVTKTVCDGCPNLRAKRWKDHLDNDETDSGTEATCAQAHRHISMYWREGDATPPWCPMTAALTEKSHE